MTTFDSALIKPLATLLLCGASWCAQAAVTTTASASSWAAAVPAATLIHFDDLPDATPVSTQYAAAGVVFAPFNSSTLTTAAETSPFSAPNLLSMDNPALGQGGGVSIVFSTPRNAVAFRFADSQFAGNWVTLSNAAGAELARWEMPYPHPTEWLFVGFVSSASDIARIDVAIGDNDRVTLDDLAFAAPVPEPARAWLLLAGMALLARRFTATRGAGT